MRLLAKISWDLLLKVSAAAAREKNGIYQLTCEMFFIKKIKNVVALYRNKIKSKLTDFSFAILLNLSLKSIKRLNLQLKFYCASFFVSLPLSVVDAVRKLFDDVLYLFNGQMKTFTTFILL